MEAMQNLPLSQTGYQHTLEQYTPNNHCFLETDFLFFAIASYRLSLQLMNL